MIASAWRLSGEEGRTYAVQVEKFKSKKEIKDIFDGWHEASFGWNIRENFRISVFQKDFDSEQAWLDWAEKFPAELVEIKHRAGVTKVIKLTKKGSK
jgi:hypothetical protein